MIAATPINSTHLSNHHLTIKKTIQWLTEI
jgi:hypothetical protein